MFMFDLIIYMEFFLHMCATLYILYLTVFKYILQLYLRIYGISAFYWLHNFPVTIEVFFCIISYTIDVL